ncbi:hypothetical protein RAD16_35630 [Bradyrhizobium sp. 18BD]
MKFRVLQVALAGLALITGGSASAAPLVYGAYYDETNGRTCSATSNCRLDFSQSPTNKLVLFRKVNCYISSTSPLYAGILGIATTFGGDPIYRFLPLPIPAPLYVGSHYYTNFEADIRWLMGQGRFPYLEFVATSATFNISCTIVGDLIDPVS